jgi:excisionase family DNA binding protein
VAMEVTVILNKLTLTVAEAGEVLGISRGLAYDLVRRGDLPSIRLGGRIVVPVRPLMAMLGGDGEAQVAI